MSFKQKYLKYKNKYLNLKNMKGGSIINFKKLSEITEITKLNIDLITMNDHNLVPMDSYEILSPDNPNILTTTGLVDCVAVMIYNPIHGRYFAHYSKFNEFFEDLSNACEIIPNKNNCVKTQLQLMQDCDNDAQKIKATIPIWANDDTSIINILNNSNSYLTLSRLKQLNEIITKGTINVYFPSQIDNEDKKVIKLQIPEIPDATITRLSSGNALFIEIYIMLNNGQLYRAIKDTLKDNEPLYNFYTSLAVNRIASYHANQKCIKQYSFKKSQYELNKEKYDDLRKLFNDPNNRLNLYQLAFNKI